MPPSEELLPSLHSRSMLPAACAQRLNALCDNVCPLFATHGPLVAALDGSARSNEQAWRCYAKSALNAAGRYAGGTAYCTRHSALSTLLQEPICAHKSEAQRVEVSALGESSAAAVAAAPLVEPVTPLVPWPARAGEEYLVEALELAASWQPTPEQELLKVRAWQVPCIDSLAQHTLNNRTRNVSRRKAFLSRRGLQCYHEARCVRGVVDGFATAAEIEQMLTLAPSPEPSRPGNINTWRWEVPPEPSVFRTLVARAQTVLREQYGVGDVLFYRSNIITWNAPECSGGRTGCTNWPAAPLPWQPSSLHGDTNTDEMFIYTTILYLSQHGIDVHGGETGIADAIADSTPTMPYYEHVTAGLRVQPSIGRLLVFSSGVENMHEMLRVSHGTRIACQMWFACKGMKPGWARPQREAFAAEYGWGGPDDKSDVVRFEPPRVSPRSTKPWPWRTAEPFGGA